MMIYIKMIKMTINKNIKDNLIITKKVINKKGINSLSKKQIDLVLKILKKVK